MDWNLRPADRLSRTAIHDEFGGSGRAGIAPSSTLQRLFANSRVNRQNRGGGS
jgi:hypothetical protein